MRKILLDTGSDVFLFCSSIKFSNTGENSMKVENGANELENQGNL